MFRVARPILRRVAGVRPGAARPSLSFDYFRLPIDYLRESIENGLKLELELELKLELCHLTEYLVYNSLQFQPSDSRHYSPPKVGLNL